jgi:hypothetical protein
MITATDLVTDQDGAAKMADRKIKTGSIDLSCMTRGVGKCAC